MRTIYYVLTEMSSGFVPAGGVNLMYYESAAKTLQYAYRPKGGTWTIQPRRGGWRNA